MKNLIFSFAILLCLVSGQTAITLLSTEPATGSTGFEPGDSVIFMFDQEVTCGASCVVSVMQGGVEVNSIDMTDLISGSTITIKPQLESNTEYSFVIAADALVGFAGTTLTFTTADMLEPVLQETYPADNGEIELIDTIKLVFDEKIFPNENFTMVFDCNDNSHDSTFDENSASFRIEEATILFDVNIPSYCHCSLTINEGSIEDASGNIVSSKITLNFHAKDVIPPEYGSITLYPKNDTLDADLKSDVIIAFKDESHIEMTGVGIITMICDYHTFEFTHQTLTVTDDNVVTLYHQAEFDKGDNVTVIVPAGFFIDAGGHTLGGYTFSFHVHEDNVEPEHPPLACDLTAFEEYLHRYPFKLHGSTYEQYIEDHKEELEKSCHSYNWKIEQPETPSDMTVFFDWTDDQMDELGELSFGYNKIVQIYEEGEFHKPKHGHVKRHRKVRQWMDASMHKYCNKDVLWSTSWATSIVEVAESVLDDKIELSVEQLIDCLPLDINIGADTTKGGVPPKAIEMYLEEVGLMRKQDYKGKCSSIDRNKTYRFKAVKPKYPTATYLMDLIDENENKKVFTMVALKTRKLRHVKDMSHAERPFRCADYEPSTFGVVSGYMFDEDNMDNSYWDIVSHIVPCEEMSVRIPMSRNMTDANYAGIAAFAFTLERQK